MPLEQFHILPMIPVRQSHNVSVDLITDIGPDSEVSKTHKDWAVRFEAVKTKEEQLYTTPPPKQIPEIENILSCHLL